MWSVQSDLAQPLRGVTIVLDAGALIAIDRIG